MIVLDTNVLSELLRPAPEPRVLTWLANQPRASLFTTAVTQGEILYGIRLLPDGQRRRKLAEAALAIFNEDFAGRVLSFDGDAAGAYAEIGTSRRAAGRPISQFDAMIAAMTRSRGATLATRNAKDFEGCGIDVVNPWAE
ncbi:MAG: type II toxin-antitoxin system VapC family toxin [Gammaproteobacteria bacterium]|nr:MAG: type II toxin-antitoxin system VapC family toxin [Gammaproteobacteria bacterium]